MTALFPGPIAHRGFHNKAAGIIENSRSAFDRAIADGFAIECDLQLSRDGVPVVFHDPALERLTGRSGFIRDLTSAEIAAMPLTGSAGGDCPQTFADLLQQVAGQVPLQVELKHQHGKDTERLAKAAAEAVHSYRGPLVFMSFDPRLIEALPRFGYRGKRGIITERFADLSDPDTAAYSATTRFALRHLLHYPWSRFDFISCDHTALDLPAVRLMRSRGMPVTTWTIRSPDAGRAALRGADQIVFEGFDPRIG